MVRVTLVRLMAIEPAAMRYTEIRMERIAHDTLADLDKETVDYVPNYDGTEKIPDVLPTKIPNLIGQMALLELPWDGDQYPASQSNRSDQRLFGLSE